MWQSQNYLKLSLIFKQQLSLWNLEGQTTTKVADKIEVVSKIESAEKKNTESKVAEKTSEVDKESVEKDKNCLKTCKGTSS